MLAFVDLIHSETDTKKGKKEEENEANIAKFLFKQSTICYDTHPFSFLT